MARLKASEQGIYVTDRRYGFPIYLSRAIGNWSKKRVSKSYREHMAERPAWCSESRWREWYARPCGSPDMNAQYQMVWRWARKLPVRVNRYVFRQEPFTVKTAARFFGVIVPDDPSPWLLWR